LSVALDRVSKRFGEFTALDEVSFTIDEGELVALVGPSGSGKSTLLRVVAGLERQDSGIVQIHGEDAAPLGPGDRRIGFVFQHYALFRHMTVFENVAFGLRVRPRRERPAGAEITRVVKDLLELVELGALGGRYPTELSGGQQQRVALARALAVQPRVLLLDEPFGALDARVRKQLRQWLRNLHNEVKVTTVLVTHDSEEACEVADRVAVMHEGRIAQIGTAKELAREPGTPFLGAFLDATPRRSGHASRPFGVAPEGTS
jgi:sulfate/thiosulfate transport system ATP-binding protein